MLPDKLNPVVRPLMEVARREENTLVQGYAASNIARLLQLCAARSPCPNAKIVKNLCSSVCVDPMLTPSAACPVPPASTPAIQESSKGERKTLSPIPIFSFAIFMKRDQNEFVRKLFVKCLNLMQHLSELFINHFY